MGADELRSRLTAVEGEVLLLQREIDSIRLALRSQAAPTSRSASPDVGEPMHPRQPFPPRPASSVVHQASARKSPAVSAPTPRVPKAPRLEIDFAELFGAQAFAWAGGVVTLLGVLFFFALAVNHGWIGPTARVALGGGASVGVVLAALWLRRRFGETYASLAGAGAGIAGGYGTLAAATALYDLVSKPVALAAGAAIAAVAVAIALAWRAELVAALGVVGAIGAPALLAVQGGLTVAGTGFAAVMAVAAGVLGVRIRWTWVLVAAAVAGVPQIAVLVIEAHRSDFGTVAVACVFALLYLATGVAEQLARKDDTLAPLPVAFVVGSIGVCWLTADQLFGPVQALRAGTALLVAAGVFFVVTVTVWRRGQRELGTLLGAIALAAAAVGVADALSGATIAYTFAAEAVVLGVAAQRLREPRVLLGALAYIVLAGAHALAFDAPPKALFEAARHPASGAGALASVAAAAFAVGYLSRTPWRASAERGVLRFVGVIVAALRAHIEELRVAAVATGCLFAANALSLLVLECCERVWPSGGVVASFHRGHVVLTALWSLVGLVAVVVASRRGAATARLLAYGWLAVTAVKVAAYDWSRLVGPGFLLAFVTLAGALLLAAFFDELLARRARLAEETLAVVLAAVGFGVASTYHLDGGNNRGYAFLAMAGVVGGLAASIFRRASFRDLATLLWVPALALAAAAYGLLLDGSWLTLAWSAGAAVLASLAVATSERRLELASFGYLALAAGGAFVEAPPWHLVVARTHPAHGIAGLLLLVCALLACAWPLRAREGWARWWWSSLWAAGAVALYAASLVILELSVRISTASLHTDFQRGHSAVSAVWGLLGLVLLYLGLRRSRRALRLAGFVLFAVSLGKLFVYDLSQLSSITRALSFLAVGAVLLLAGFFTQRLTRQLGGGDGDELHQPVV